MLKDKNSKQEHVWNFEWTSSHRISHIIIYTKIL